MNAPQTSEDRMRIARLHVIHGYDWLHEGEYPKAYRDLVAASRLVGARNNPVRPFLLDFADRSTKMNESKDFAVAQRVIQCAMAVEPDLESPLTTMLGRITEAKTDFCNRIAAALSDTPERYAAILDSYAPSAPSLEPISFLNT